MFGRPWVVFDPANKEHREWYADFNNNQTWSHCPVRFVVDDDAGDLITMIQRKLIAYYTNKEFGKRNSKKVLTDTQNVFRLNVNC